MADSAPAAIQDGAQPLPMPSRATPAVVSQAPAASSASSAFSAAGPPVPSSTFRPEPVAPAALSAPPTPSPSASPAAVKGFQERPVLLVLVGLPGSGKTTFGNALVSAIPGWVRCSQDESVSGRRQEVEAAVRGALLAGQNVIVDRVNFDPTQRGHFLAIAQETGARRLSIVLRAPFDVLRQRLLERTDHPTLKDSETALKVLGRMRRELVYPQTFEGFERVLFVDSEGGWTKERLEETLQRLEREGTTGQRPRRGGYGGGFGRGGQRGHSGPRGGYGGGQSMPRDGPASAPRGSYGGRGLQQAPRGHGLRGGGPRPQHGDNGRGGYSRAGYHGDRPDRPHAVHTTNAAPHSLYHAQIGYSGELRGRRGSEHAALNNGSAGFGALQPRQASMGTSTAAPSGARHGPAGLPPRPPSPGSGPGAAGDSGRGR